MKIPAQTKKWLLDAPEPYIRYQAQRLLTPERADPELLRDDPFIRENIEYIAGWRDDTLSRHDKPDHFLHRLSMLAVLGVTIDTPGMGRIAEDLGNNIGDDGSFPVNIIIPTAFGGTGEASPNWIICDFPSALFSLAELGVTGDKIEKGFAKLQSLAGDDYYTCCGSIPKFKGPGKRGEVCPYANMLTARAFGAYPAHTGSESAKKAAEAVLTHWENRKSRKPFLFGMGTDFLKLKFPLVWYNLLNALYSLKGIEGVSSDRRYKEMKDHLKEKLDGEGKVKAESIYMIYKKEEWGNKRDPSRLLTILTYRLLLPGDGALG
jgi:hypothetical protein